MNHFMESVEKCGKQIFKYYTFDDAQLIINNNLNLIYNNGWTSDLYDEFLYEYPNHSIDDNRNWDEFWNQLTSSEQFIAFTNNLYENGYQDGYRDGSQGTQRQEFVANNNCASSYAIGYLDGHADGSAEVSTN